MKVLIYSILVLKRLRKNANAMRKVVMGKGSGMSLVRDIEVILYLGI